MHGAMKDVKSCTSDDDSEDLEGDCKHEECRKHGGFAGIKGALHHRREQLMANLQASASRQQMGGSSESSEMATAATQDAAVAELSSLSLKSCRHCNGGGKLMVCTRCKAAHYCSKEHQRADWLNGHRESCKAPGSDKQLALVGLSPVQTSEKPLGLEMLELLEIFRSVHKDMPEENKEVTLRKVIHVCEQIIRRGNPDNIPIPQVFYMLQDARQMLRPFKLEKEGIIEPEEEEPEPKVEPEPRIEIRNKLQVIQKKNLKKISGKSSVRRP